jgi:Domain of unknown function (DUF4386)
LSNTHSQKTGAVLVILGALGLLIGTLLHPLNADPNDPLAAFTEYAANAPWVASHLLQLLGIILMVFGLVLLGQFLATGGGASWAAVAGVSAAASMAVAIALQAVDGVALKFMVNAWANAPAADKQMLFYATFGVRQIEVGLAAMSSLMLGVTVMLYSAALIADQRFPKWLGWLGLVGGLPTAVSGIIMAYMGFSDMEMMINMPASGMVLAWVLAVGVAMWRLEPNQIAVKSDSLNSAPYPLR